MTKAIERQQQAVESKADLLERVLIEGDLSKLSPAERLSYYRSVCESLGLNPLTKPFEYIRLNGRLTLYARRDAADQLRKIHGISIEIADQSIQNGIFIVRVRARTPDGRTDEDFGAVPIEGLSPEAASNAILKAITKAKRRVTLSIAGLGWLDETEVESIPAEAAAEEGTRPTPKKQLPKAPAKQAASAKPTRKQVLAETLAAMGIARDQMQEVVKLFLPFNENQVTDERAGEILELVGYLIELAGGDEAEAGRFVLESLVHLMHGDLASEESIKEQYEAWKIAQFENEG